MNRKVTLLLTVLLILSVLVPVTTASGLAQEGTPTPQAADSLYRDPQGRFTVPIPPNWTAQQAEGYGVLTGSNEEISIYVLALPGEDIEVALEAAWQRVNPGFDLTPEQVTELPPASGVEQALSITYETEAENRLVQGAGRLYEGTVYLILIEAQLNALQQRSSQVNVVQSGYTITALDQVDLSDTEPLPLTGEMLADFESYIEEVRERFNVPGAAVAVVQGDEIVYTNGFGVRDFDTGQPVTPETQMMIGSTTKTFTTMLMADLVDEELMTWDTPAVDLLPSFSLADPELTEQIEVRHLVCNCTGVSRRDTELLFNAADMTAEDIIDSLDTFEIFTDFGEAFQYSNQMIATGGYAAAAATGGKYGNLHNAYAQALQQRILTPISMTQTTLSFAAVQAGENYATPHGLNLDLEYYPLPLSVEAFVEPVAPAGGLWSTVSDMGRYLITELSRGVAPDGERVVSADNLTRTWQPQVQVSATTSYGLGWFVGAYKGQRMIYHPGGTFGFTSDLVFLPDADLGLAILANGRDTSAFNQAVRYRLLELAFDQPHEQDSQATFSYDQLEQQYADIRADLADRLEPDTVAPYLGLYHHPALGDVTLTLAEDEQRLVMDVGEFKGEFRPVAGQPGRFVAYAAPAMTGIPLQLSGAEEKESQLVVGVGLGVAEYTFEKVAEVEEVTFENGDATLAGTLTLPLSPGPHPAVVTLTGSGPQDRDNASAVLPGYRPYRQLAHRLVREGIAVLRYDDRGVGQSTGDLTQSTAETLVSDAQAALDYLRDREKIDPEQIGLLGHSEGGLIAAMAAAQAPEVGFVISLAGPAVSGYVSQQEALQRYVEAGIVSAEAAETQRQATDLALAGEWDRLEELLYQTTLSQLEALPEEARASLGDLQKTAREAARQALAEYRQPRFAFQVGYDPAETWSQVTVPVLGLYAELDNNVPARLNQAALQETLVQAGNDEVTIRIVPGVNHLFQPANSADPAEWSTGATILAPKVLEIISNWLLERTDA